MVSGKHFLFFDAELNLVYYDFNTDLLLTIAINITVFMLKKVQQKKINQDFTV